MDLIELKRRMTGASDVFVQELSGIRTGRASAGLLEPIKISCYGSDMPINQLATVNVPEIRLITVQVWDQSLLQTVEKGIRDSGLGLNPVVDGQIIRVPIPELNEERRKELTKVVGKYAERARIAVRNVRRGGMDQLKRSEKTGEISKDEHKGLAQDIQEMTDQVIKEIDNAHDSKSREVMQV